jgi:hypothetical protein
LSSSSGISLLIIGVLFIVGGAVGFNSSYSNSSQYCSEYIDGTCAVITTRVDTFYPIRIISGVGVAFGFMFVIVGAILLEKWTNRKSELYG